MIRAFNQTYLEVLRSMDTSFGDQSSGLRAEFHWLRDMVAHPENYTEPHRVFAQDVSTDRVGKLMSRDLDALGGPLFERMEWRKLYDVSMVEEEREVMWNSLRAVCRLSSVMRACGDGMAQLEDTTAEFVKKHKDKPSDNLQSVLMDDLLSGGETSQKLLSAFKGPDLKNMVTNVINIMNTGEGGEGANPLEALSKMTANMENEMSKEWDMFHSDGNFGPMAQAIKSSGLTRGFNPADKSSLGAFVAGALNSAKNGAGAQDNAKDGAGALDNAKDGAGAQDNAKDGALDSAKDGAGAQDNAGAQDA
jgi:hypothetical protein